MQQVSTPPVASPITEHLVVSILRSAPETREVSVPFTLANPGEFSNDLAEVRLADGRTVIVKRGRFAWSRGRFHAARLASGLLRDSGIVAPLPFDLAEHPEHGSLEAYWRIDAPTLAERWPELSELEQRQAMRTLGQLLRRLHQQQLPGYGGLATLEQRPAPLAQILADDLGGRLLPAVTAQWSAGVALVERLLELAPVVARRAPEQGVLLHGDLHLGNLLCDGSGAELRCVGLLDLEDVHAGPRESDLARLAVLHGELFSRPIAAPFMEWVLEGYAAELDPLVFGFYRLYHLVNLGYYSALVGHAGHAEQVAVAAQREAESLQQPGGSSRRLHAAADLATLPEVGLIQAA